MVKRNIPENLEPLGLGREESAGFVGVSPNTFDMMVERNEMPRPRMFGTRLLWSRREIEEAFHRLPAKGGTPINYDCELDRQLGL